MSLKIEFIQSQSNFRGEKKTPSKDELFDTSYISYQGTEHAIVGRLRFPFVDNADLNYKHPIFDANGDNVGFLVRGMETLGYIFHCVYVDKAECFYLAHIPVPRGSPSYISVVSNNGGFLLGKGIKFEVTQSFEIPDSAIYILTFKVIEDQRYLLIISKHGFCLIDTLYRSLVSRGLCCINPLSSPLCKGIY